MLVDLAKSEPDAEVRSQLACTARRLPAGLPIITALATRDEDAADPFLPQLCWHALEHHLKGKEAEVLKFLADPAVWQRPLVANQLLPRLMRRLVAEERQENFLTAAKLLQLAPDNEKARPLLTGFNEAVQGRDLSGMPEALTAALAARGGLTLPLRLRKGEAAAVPEAIALAGDANARAEDRALCVKTLGEMRLAASIPALLDLAADAKSPTTLRRAALSALGSFDSAGIPPRLLALIPDAPADVKTAAFTTLAGRPAWAAALVQALQSGRPALSSVPLEIIETLRLHPDKSLAAAALKLFPPAAAANFQKKIASVEAALKVPGGSPYEGEAIFTQRCAGCHRLFFKGGNIGPDLTAYQRDNLGTMLVSIVNPNAEIREGFACQIIETTGGQTLSGYLVEQTPTVVRLRTMDGQTTTLSAQEIKSVAPLGRSLMPEGLLDGLTDPQIRDLFAWLRQSQPISR